MAESPFEATQNYDPDSSELIADAASAGDEIAAEHPDRIGRYRIERVLGKGGFGLVYLAHDDQLGRHVAVKVPHARHIMKPQNAEAYLSEARTVANLDHPGIVPVHDIGSTETFPCFIVSKYIEGTDLATKLRQRRFQYRETAELIATVAETLHCAHKQGLVHRDVKPGNILIDAEGKPYVVDFGLALREENIGLGPKYAGTPAYMSPEQARGEGHRVDGRSDVFSLGVVLYEMLAGRQPFRGETRAELLERVTGYEPRPLRQCDDHIPKELERICYKALAKRASERYSTAKDFAEDLRLFLAEQTLIQSSTSRNDASAHSETHASTSVISSDGSTVALSASHSDSRPVRIVPKGLRSFDAHDSDFFLELLPGPRDREGLPDSLRFWKTRIEETDSDNTFAVGLIYGPSGCGKSSLVKAGLLPRLSEDVIPVYIESTPEGTETRLLHGLRKHCPAVTDNLSLKDTLTALRCGEGRQVGRKVLIVLDQFEQWLYARKDEENADLVQALRQCDGGRVQCIVMIRDDFWLAVSRFLKELEIRLEEGQNSALADLFDLDHARKVLAAFGRAFGRLPDNISETTKDQQEFIDQAVSGLAEEGKVICVRLALFAEMMKGKTWTPATLKQVGGTKGIGVTFLEETFSATTAPPDHRLHQKAARAVLNALLPAAGKDIKGYMRSHAELLEASGYANRLNDFDDLIHILDSEIRLITPTDPEGKAPDDQSEVHVEAGQKYYQLTHDYLVHSLRDWLTRKQKETRRGRAVLKLLDTSATWNSKPENRFLPSWWEHLNIRLLTDRKKWTVPQRKMMARADRLHLSQGILALVLLLIVVFAAQAVRLQVIRHQQEAYASGLLESLSKAEMTQVPAIVNDLMHYPEWVEPRLKDSIARTEDGSPEKLRLALALLPFDRGQIDYLRDQLPVCTLNQFPVVRDALRPHQTEVRETLWNLALDEQQDPARRFQAAAALADYVPQDERWRPLTPIVAQQLTSNVSPVYLSQWLTFYHGVGESLTGPLASVHADRENRPAKQRETAALALAEYLQQQPEKLVDSIVLADNIAEFRPLISALRPHAATVREKLVSIVQTPLLLELNETNDNLPEAQQKLRDAHWKMQSMAAITLLHLGYDEQVWQLLKHTPHPSLRSFTIHLLGELQTNHNLLAAQLQSEPDTSIRRALIQSLGGLNSEMIRPADRSRIVEQLLVLYLDDPDPGIHSSASWTLRRWRVTLPELPAGEPTLTAEQTQQFAGLENEVAKIRQRIADSMHELPIRQALWERQMREQTTVLPQSLNTGLIAHFPLDELQGTATANTVEGRPSGSFQGAAEPIWSSGAIDGAIRFDGTGSVVSGGPVTFSENEAFSCGCWFTSDHPDGVVLISNEDPDNAFRGIEMGILRGEFEVIISSGEPEKRFWSRRRIKVRAVAPSGFPQPYWQHLFATYDGSGHASGVRLYLNGEPQTLQIEDDALQGTFATDRPLQIGGRAVESYRFRGQIDDVRVYQRKLTDEEIRQLFEDGLRAVARISAESRTAGQQALLDKTYSLRDELLQNLNAELTATQQALQTARSESMHRWYVNSQGQTMILISNTAKSGRGRIAHGFAISSHEVTVAEFRQYLSRHQVESTVAPTDDCPVHLVNWYMAAGYCNWLSQQDGIPEEQWVYEPNDNQQFAAGMRIKQDYLELSGYRLPTIQEWDYACRAGSDGYYSFGEPIELLPWYAQYVINSFGRSHAVESLLPNDAGLFDMHGNVWEWTNTPPISPVLNSADLRLRSGAFHLRSMAVRTAVGNHFRPFAVYDYVGFRPCRTFNVSPDSTGSFGSDADEPD